MRTFLLLATIVTFGTGASHASEIGLADIDINAISEKNVFTLDIGASNASGPEEVVSPYLKIIGKGFENKKTHEILALSCGGETLEQLDCSNFRFVLYKPTTGKSYYVGSPIKITKQDKNALKKVLKDFRKKYQKSHPTVFQRTGEKIGNFIDAHLSAFTWPVAIASFGYSCYLMSGAAAIGLGGGILVLVAPPMAVIGLIVTMKAMPDMTMLGQKMDSASFQNTEGWNWSIHPKKISDRKFQEILNFI